LKLPRSTLLALLQSVKKDVYVCITEKCKYERLKLEKLFADNGITESWENGEITTIDFNRDPEENRTLTDLKLF